MFLGAVYTVTTAIASAICQLPGKARYRLAHLLHAVGVTTPTHATCCLALTGEFGIPHASPRVIADSSTMVERLARLGARPL